MVKIGLKLTKQSKVALFRNSFSKPTILPDFTLTHLCTCQRMCCNNVLPFCSLWGWRVLRRWRPGSIHIRPRSWMICFPSIRRWCSWPAPSWSRKEGRAPAPNLLQTLICRCTSLTLRRWRSMLEIPYMYFSHKCCDHMDGVWASRKSLKPSNANCLVGVATPL